MRWLDRLCELRPASGPATRGKAGGLGRATDVLEGVDAAVELVLGPGGAGEGAAVEKDAVGAVVVGDEQQAGRRRPAIRDGRWVVTHHHVPEADGPRVRMR